MIFLTTWNILLILYIVLNFIFSINIYTNYRKFKRNKKVTDPATNKEIDVNELYPEFIRNDDIGFFRVFFGLVFFFWFKIIAAFSSVCILCGCLL